MSFLRHGGIYRSDDRLQVGAPGRTKSSPPQPHRLDEFPAGYSSAGCSPAGHGTKLGRKKEAAIAALLSQRNLEEAARVVGVSAKTLTRWQRLPEFQEALRETRRTAFGQCLVRLQQASPVAATILVKIMIDEKAPAATRVRAATSVLTLGIRAMEDDDLAVRVAKLEQAAEWSKTEAFHETDNPD